MSKSELLSSIQMTFRTTCYSVMPVIEDAIWSVVTRLSQKHLKGNGFVLCVTPRNTGVASGNSWQLFTTLP